jgi:predicted murein hydrolase (TIGR00659 family)
MIDGFVKDPIFGITLTLLAYGMGLVIQKRLKSHMANPILIACIIIIGLLLIGKIPYESYNEGGKYISFLLGPATVALAVPLYRNFKLVRQNKLAILLGIISGSITGVLSASLIAAAFGASRRIAVSLSPKSVTSPIAMGISKMLGGYPSLTAAVVIITGILGAIAGPEFLKLLGIKDRIAKGTALGTASHGIGTTRAIQEGEEEGAMSGLAIGAAGIVTSIAAPILIKLFLQ